MSSRGAEPHDHEPARQPTLAAYAPEPVLPPAASAPDWRSRQGRWVDRSLSGRHHLPCCRGLFRPVAKSNPSTIPRSKRQRPSYRSRPHTPNLWTVPWQGVTLDELIGEKLCGEIVSLSKISAAGGLIGKLQTRDGESLDVSVFFTPPYVVVELEPSSPDEQAASGMMMDRLAVAAAGFEQATSLPILCEKAAIEFRRLTGFDRVMVYRFLDDAAGKVMGEDKREGLHSFLNHHF